MAASLWWDDESSSSGSRQNNQKSKYDDIFVFGYACKLFRDDEKAKDIDSGKLLIPWMGDEKLMIDRYDGRGHLYDLAAHDAAFVAKRPHEMSEQEEAIEKACEEERYLELHTDLQEEAMYEEDEWKRYYLALQEGYKAVGFSYDEPQEAHQEETQAVHTDTPVEDEKPFVVPEELQVPPTMQKPTSSKHHARIEKTANFIAKQGIQMEIMVKTKQSGNAQFDFLHFENELNPYYKHVVSMMKSGRYKYRPLHEEAGEEHKGDGDYLHPSLSSTPQLPPPPPPVSRINMMGIYPKPSKPIELPKVSIHDTPYGALIQSIKRNNVSALDAEKTASPNTVETDDAPMVPTVHSGHGDQNQYPLPLTGESAYQYQQQPQSFNGPTLMESLYGPLPASDSPTPRSSRKKKRRRRYSSSDSSSSSSSSSSRSRSSRRKKRRESPTPTPTVRAEGPSAIIPPPPEMQPIVDRMALYVAKNGLEFEIVVKGRNDPRFQFLNEYHALFPYYSLKREAFLKELGKDVTTDKGEEKAKKEEESSQGGGARSVSFSIKVKAKESETAPPEKPKVFEYDTSEGEEDSRQEQQFGSGNISRSATPPVRSHGIEESSVKQSLEEKLKDKLASALKERISQSNKEKTLQAERKKKAAMFLTMLKTNSQPQSSPPHPPPTTSVIEDSSSLYVGEAPSAGVNDYDSQHRSHHKDRQRSPKERHHRRKRSPTPPSAYSLGKRSPSPSSWQSRVDPWGASSNRDRERESTSNRWDKDVPNRSPVRKKKHKRSKSRSPQRTERSKHSKEKSKHKSKDHKEKKRSRHSKDRDDKKKSTKRDKSGSSSDVEILDQPSKEIPSSSSSSLWSSKPSHMGTSGSGLSPSHDSAAVSRSDLPAASSVALSDRGKKWLGESVDSRDSLGEMGLSMGNSPSASSTNDTKDSTPYSESTTASSDFMSKVRAMLKKSREISKEDSIEDT